MFHFVVRSKQLVERAFTIKNLHFPPYNEVDAFSIVVSLHFGLAMLSPGQVIRKIELVFSFPFNAARYVSKIYTRTGDKGTSVTFTGERRPKDDDIFEALGSTDELSSTIGLARDLLPESCHDVLEQLEEIQCVLQDLASSVATPKSSGTEYHKKRTEFDGQHVDQLEKWIDQFTQGLPPLRNFILPSGGAGSSSLHIARSVCRRAERRLVPLVRSGDVDEAPMKYLNRLSDYLFTVARVAAKAHGKEEAIYRRPKAPSVK